MSVSALHEPEIDAGHGEANYNLAGQKLGRKGQETRERILAAAMRLFDDPHGPPVMLTTIAAAANIRLTNLYLYFPDFEELLLDVLKRVMETDAAFMDMLRKRWPDEMLGACCRDFLMAHYGFWKRHSRLLHMRNSYADTDMRILQYRHQVTLPLLELVIGQMDAEPDREMENKRMATVILAGFERMATVVTGPHFLAMNQGANNGSDEEIALALIGAEARVLELVIRAQRKES